MFNKALSIIIPIYNEKESVKGLLKTLSSQKNLSFEVIFSDGGSKDGTVKEITSLKENCPFPIVIIHCEKGRGRQMNFAVHLAKFPNLFFLHADSSFKDPLALKKAIDAFQDKIQKAGYERIGARFNLCFMGSEFQSSSFGYYFYELKAKLNRPGCINGDQGLLVRRDFFNELGGFDEELPFLEDKAMEKKIFDKGEWFLLPSEIFTSPRRFKSEGLFERQTLNALIMNFFNIGWSDFFHEAALLYKSQNEAKKLNLAPFFKKIKFLLNKKTFKEKIDLWFKTGAYISKNAWQLAFYFDAKKAYRQRQKYSPTFDYPFLKKYDRFIAPIMNTFLVNLMVMILTWVWFQGVIIYHENMGFT